MRGKVTKVAHEDVRGGENNSAAKGRSDQSLIVASKSADRDTMDRGPMELWGRVKKKVKEKMQ